MQDRYSKDILDRAARLLGVADVSDRAARLLGVIASISNAVEIKAINGSIRVHGLSDLSLNTAYTPLVVRDVGFTYGAAYGSTTALAANTPGNIIAAASNVNGYLLWDCGADFSVAGGSTASLLAKATAPATVIDGNVLMAIRYGTGGTNRQISGQLGGRRYVAAGLRLDRISTLAEVAPGLSMALYTLL